MILDELKKTPLSSSDIFKLFSNHKTKEELEVVLSELQAANQIEQEKEITPGRPKITWRAINRELSE